MRTAAHACDTIPPEGHHAFAYSPSKLGSLLPPDEYKAKARPAKAAKQSASGGPAHAAAADYSPASVAEPMVVAANTTTPLRAVAPAADASAGAPRARRAKQTAALLQPVPAAPAPVARSSKTDAAKPAAAAPAAPRAAAKRAAARTPKSRCKNSSCSTRTC